MSSEDRLRSLLSDLGKATLRGVKKCPKCGTYNGSRGSCCKNKFCDAVFKEVGEKRKLATEACKLITGSVAQVFSVRVRDKGPDYRGFVQLPLINTAISNDITTFISQTSALCFVDSCERSFDTSVLKCHEKNLSDNIVEPTCQHIQAALKCYAEARPLTLKNSILSSLNVNNETKREIWLLATETSGPLVQRVSKNIMAVKCKVSPEHPLGYLHLCFYITKLKEKIEHGYSCNCLNLKSNPEIIADKNGQVQTVRNKCAHFYACICAFASDPKLSDEFKYYINLDDIELSVDNSSNSTHHCSETEKIIGMDLQCLIDNSHLLVFRDDTMTAARLNDARLDIVDGINVDNTILPNSTTQEDVDCEDTVVENSTVASQTHNTETIELAAAVDGQIENILDGESVADTRCHIISRANYSLDNSRVNLVNNAAARVPDTPTRFNVKDIKLFDHCATIENNSIRKGNNNSCTCNSNSSSSSSNSSCGDCSSSNSSNSSRSSSSCSSSSSSSSSRAILRDIRVLTQINKFHPSPTKRKRDEHLLIPHLNLNNLNLIEIRKRKAKPAITKKSQNVYESLDETNTSISFIKWLASITERINQTMHFQFDGKPEPLVFHVPQIFFDCLRERLSCGGKKKRLPNSTTAFIRKDGVPLGTFTKYTWQITNILHVKSIFETPLIPLEITRSFVQNTDGTYKLYTRDEYEIDQCKKRAPSAMIKPLELKTYLKVGNTLPDQTEPTPFLIEWIPDILPVSKIGELRIRFEFGHVNNEVHHKLDKIALSRNS